MDFLLNDEQKKIQEEARKFAEEDLKPGILDRDANCEFPLEQFKKFGKTGIYGYPYPEEVGGIGGSYLGYILAVEEVSKVDGAFGISFSVDTSLYGGSIMNSGVVNISAV